MTAGSVRLDVTVGDLAGAVRVAGGVLGLVTAAPGGGWSAGALVSGVALPLTISAAAGSVSAASDNSTYVDTYGDVY